MATPTQGVLAARVVFETDPGNKARTKAFVIQQLKSTFRSLKNANIAIAVLEVNDDNEILIGVDITGSPSEVMKKIMDREFADDSVAQA